MPSSKSERGIKLEFFQNYSELFITIFKESIHPLRHLKVTGPT